MENEKALKATAAYWAGQLFIKEKKKDFEAALLKFLNEEWDKAPLKIYLEVDYDPMGILLDALREVGIECRGFMFSAEGIFPQKTRSNTGFESLEVTSGYGTPWKKIEI